MNNVIKFWLWIATVAMASCSLLSCSSEGDDPDKDPDSTRPGISNIIAETLKNHESFFGNTEDGSIMVFPKNVLMESGAGNQTSTVYVYGTGWWIESVTVESYDGTNIFYISEQAKEDLINGGGYINTFDGLKLEVYRLDSEFLDPDMNPDDYPKDEIRAIRFSIHQGTLNTFKVTLTNGTSTCDINGQTLNLAGGTIRDYWDASPRDFNISADGGTFISKLKIKNWCLHELIIDKERIPLEEDELSNVGDSKTFGWLTIKHVEDGVEFTVDKNEGDIRLFHVALVEAGDPYFWKGSAVINGSQRSGK